MDLTKIKEGTRVKSINKDLIYFPAGSNGTIIHKPEGPFPTDRNTLRDSGGDYWIKVDDPVDGISRACAAPSMFKILRY